MSYTVIVLPDAEHEMEVAYDWLASQTPQHAPLWYNGMIDAILSLEELPTRCPLAPENSASPDEEIRQLLYGNPQHSYRILFSIRGYQGVGAARAACSACRRPVAAPRARHLSTTVRSFR